MSRAVLVVSHTGRAEAITVTHEVVDRLESAGIAVRLLADEAAQLGLAHGRVVASDDRPASGCELVVVIGGDGTILRGAELARPTQTPLLGVNLGHVGFLAEAESDAITVTVKHIIDQSYDVEERLTIDTEVHVNGDVLHRNWALNEVTIEKQSPQRMIEVLLEVDDRPLSRWGCDGLVMATPTGSTAHAFSAGGPVVWPSVEAFLVVPISAHALFARPLVVGPDSMIAVEVSHRTPGAALTCDGRRQLQLPVGARVEVRRGSQPVRLARLHKAPFTDRLVAKFALPVEGWRGARHASGAASPDQPTRDS